MDRNTSRVIHLLGIDSPGLTAAPAIAKYVAGLLVRNSERIPRSLLRG
jgi:glycine/D-amino acid oxidase-like deaminating enzyme